MASAYGPLPAHYQPVQTECGYREAVFEDLPEVPAIWPAIRVAEARATWLKEQSQIALREKRERAAQATAYINYINSPIPFRSNPGAEPRA